jgi:DNA-directed RNA polymerase subunit M/transcription elongation factor TFIIS
MYLTAPQIGNQGHFTPTLYSPPAQTDVRCPSCGRTAVRMVWKAVRQSQSESTASYVCDQCHHYWVAEAPN